jgi:hypothetical protein
VGLVSVMNGYASGRGVKCMILPTTRVVEALALCVTQAMTNFLRE